jgi:predicted alpha/beta hydrolase family esterase
MLTEMSVKNKRKKEIQDWIKQLQETINQIPESGTHSVS